LGIPCALYIPFVSLNGFTMVSLFSLTLVQQVAEHAAWLATNCNNQLGYYEKYLGQRTPPGAPREQQQQLEQQQEQQEQGGAPETALSGGQTAAAAAAAASPGIMAAGGVASLVAVAEFKADAAGTLLEQEMREAFLSTAGSAAGEQLQLVDVSQDVTHFYNVLCYIDCETGAPRRQVTPHCPINMAGTWPLAPLHSTTHTHTQTHTHAHLPTPRCSGLGTHGSDNAAGHTRGRTGARHRRPGQLCGCTQPTTAACRGQVQGGPRCREL
jgi:hypothetical protein